MPTPKASSPSNSKILSKLGAYNTVAVRAAFEDSKLYCLASSHAIVDNLRQSMSGVTIVLNPLMNLL